MAEAFSYHSLSFSLLKSFPLIRTSHHFRVLMTSRPYSGPTVCSNCSLGSGYICVLSGFEVFIPSGTKTSQLHTVHPHTPCEGIRGGNGCPAPVLEPLLARTKLLRTLCVPCFMFHTSDRQWEQHTYRRPFSLIGWLGLGSFLGFHV